MRLLLALLLMPGLASAAPQCLPSTVGGTGSSVFVRTDSTGIAVAWACWDQYSQSIPHFWSRWDAAVPDWQRKVAEAVDGGPLTMVAALAQFPQADRAPQGSAIVPAELFPIINDAWIAAKAKLPPAPVWKVAANGPYTTRPAYAWANGTRATTATAQVPVGRDCFCAQRSIEGSLTYCAVTISGAWVALCTRQ